MGKTMWWSDAWNPFGGCSPVSAACRLCYARRWHERMRQQGQPRYQFPFDEFTVRQDMLDDPAPLRWRKPRVCFVNNLSDTFHPDAPIDSIARLFDIMGEAASHTFLVLTKRSDLMARFACLFDWPPNVWAGVTVEEPGYTFRLADLRAVPANVLFVSAEPLLGDIVPAFLDEDWESISWIIAGGETGPKAERPRQAQADHVRALRDACIEHGIAFWFKQWGATEAPPKELPELDGQTWRGRPEAGVVPAEEEPGCPSSETSLPLD